MADKYEGLDEAALKQRVSFQLPIPRLEYYWFASSGALAADC